MTPADPITARLDDLSERVADIYQAQREDAKELRTAHTDSARQLTAEIRSVGDLVRLQGERTSIIEGKVAVLEERTTSTKARVLPWAGAAGLLTTLVEIIRHLVMNGPTLPPK